MKPPAARLLPVLQVPLPAPLALLLPALLVLPAQQLRQEYHRWRAPRPAPVPWGQPAPESPSGLG
jgi:hypothetical protein